jgi:hypothetical protein
MRWRMVRQMRSIQITFVRLIGDAYLIAGAAMVRV